MQVKVITYKKGKWSGSYYLDGWISSVPMEKHMEQMLSEGWQIQAQTGGGGRVNIGRTTLWTLATGGIGLALFGASREKEKIIVTYVKD